MTQTQTAADTIAAAIAVLVDFRESSTPGDWDIQDSGDRFIAWHDDPASTGFDYIATEPVEFANPIDAALIVTLHRTIDAQLDVLRSSLDWFVKAEAAWPQATWDKHPELQQALEGLLRQELALARAILD